MVYICGKGRSETTSLYRLDMRSELEWCGEDSRCPSRRILAYSVGIFPASRAFFSRYLPVLDQSLIFTYRLLSLLNAILPWGGDLRYSLK